MALCMELRSRTPEAWTDCVLKHFDDFLIDHASCERKASAVGMSFVVRYPDRPELLEPMILFAKEELDHFYQVYRLMARRGLTLLRDEADPYVNSLMQSVRFGREERFLDRLLVSGVIEARGTEKLTLLSQALPDPDLKAFYLKLAKAEYHHQELFEDLAMKFFPREVVKDRLNFWLDREATVFSAQDIRPAVH
ncbi:tRNA-(ms[2]io[6]A)-hydroxylase [bacterium]|nr:tRNA-(ms[2]io[6]A)-hydroxylase [bacterium]